MNESQLPDNYKYCTQCRAILYITTEVCTACGADKQ